GLAGDGYANGLDARAVVELEEVFQEAVGGLPALDDPEGLGSGLLRDPRQSLPGDALDAAQAGLAALDRGGQQFAPDLFGGAQRQVVPGEKAGAMHGP